jgi:hypothetical protein
VGNSFGGKKEGGELNSPPSKGSGANYFFFLATFFLGAAFLTTFFTAFLTAFFLTAMIKSPPSENIYHTQGVGI